MWELREVGWEEQKPWRTSPEQHLILEVLGRSGAKSGLGGGWGLRLLLM